MVLKNLLGWHLVDMTYTSVNRSAGRPNRKGWSKERTPFAELPKEVRGGCRAEANMPCLLCMSVTLAVSARPLDDRF